MKLAIACLLVTVFANAAEVGPNQKTQSSIRVVPVTATPESSNVDTFIALPKKGQYAREPVNVQIRLYGFPLGTMSDFDRKKEIYNDPNGQSMRVLIDDFPYLSIYTSFIDSLSPNTVYFDQTLTKTVPFYLEEGAHILRTFPVRSFGEGIKGSGAFAATVFYTGQGGGEGYDLTAPFLTYNMPQGQMPYEPGKPVLLDFYVSNAKLSKDGYKVQLTIDGHVERIITSWNPFYIYGLAQGTHAIRLELLDSSNVKVGGPLTDVEKEVTLY